MRKNFCLALTVYLVITLSACAKANPDRIDKQINVGDEIDSMIFTTTNEVNWDISLNFFCDFESAKETGTTTTLSCFAQPGSRILFGNCDGVAGDSPEERDEAWKKIKTQISFDGQAINLPAFGFLDDDENTVRIWNVVVENITLGTHTIECKYEREDESGTGVFVFTVSDQPESYPTLSAEAAHSIHPYTSEKVNLNYLLYLPGDYGVDSQKKWPLLLYLHGMDRVNKSVNVLGSVYPLNSLTDQDDFPFIVVAPQGTGEYEFWAKEEMVNAIMGLLDEVEGVLSVDASHIYLTGESAGGNGTWSIGVRHPERFAALVPMMGYYGWPPSVPENICDLANTPVWAFHGAKDELIPLEAEQKLIDALKACKGDVQFTIFPDAGHNLDAQNVYTTELYEWLLKQSIR